MRYVMLTFGLAALGALAGLVLAAVVAGSSSPNDVVYIPFGELAFWLSVVGAMLGGAIGLLASLVWALWRWVGARYRQAPAL